MNDVDRPGDEAAFEALVRAHAPRLLRLAYGLTGERQTAEDVVQEALLDAWRGLSNFRGDAALSTWLHTITVRTCRRHTTRAARAGRTTSDDFARHAASQWADPDYLVDPVAVLARSAERDELRSALATLPEPYRVAVLLHDVEGLPAARIAVVTGCPLGTAKARIRRGRAALVVALAAREADTPDRTGER